jgi:hypothetical protein
LFAFAAKVHFGFGSTNEVLAKQFFDHGAPGRHGGVVLDVAFVHVTIDRTNVFVTKELLIEAVADQDSS